MGVDHLLNRPLRLLSGGEQQRVMLACLLSMNCQTLLFDEPTSFLDYKGAKQFINHLKTLR